MFSSETKSFSSEKVFVSLSRFRDKVVLDFDAETYLESGPCGRVFALLAEKTSLGRSSCLRGCARRSDDASVRLPTCSLWAHAATHVPVIVVVSKCYNVRMPACVSMRVCVYVYARETAPSLLREGAPSSLSCYRVGLTRTALQERTLRTSAQEKSPL